jgi:hypothetical protein
VGDDAGLPGYEDDRRGYGFDGDFRAIPARWQAVIVTAVTAALIAVAAALAALAVRDAAAGALVSAVVTGLIALWLALPVGSYLYTTRVGRFQAWARILGDLGLRGDEQVLDLGCGRARNCSRSPNCCPAGVRSASTCGAPARFAIADLRATDQHRARLQEPGLTDVRRRNLGWRMWWRPLVSHQTRRRRL